MIQKNNLKPSQDQIATLTQKGIALHQQGNFVEAQVIYEQILVAQPDHFDALQLLGVLFAQVKKYPQAVKFLSKALEINPNHAGTNNNIGNSFKDLNRFEEALASYDQAISIDSNHVGAQSNRGLVLKELNRFEEALASYDQAITINPEYFDAYINRGNLLRDLKRFEEALASYDQAITINPDYAEAYYNRGTILQELKRFNEALTSFDQAITINPDYAEAYVDRGVALKKLNQFDKALTSYDQAITINPDYAEAYSNRGNVLQELSRFNEALTSYDQAITINPDYAEAYYNRGTMLQELKRFNEALASYAQAIKIDPDYVYAHWNASMCNLRNGNFKAGWPGYEMRWKHFQCNSEPLKSANPVWDFKKTNQRLLVWAEMGIGDHIFFGSLLSELLEDVPNLLVQIDKRLIPIFTRSLPNIKFYPGNFILPESDYDIHVPIGSLGRYLRNNEKDCEVSRYGFLKDDQVNTSKIKKDLMALTPSNNKICGISWRSSSTNTGASQNIDLKYLIEMLNLDGYMFVSLQYGETKEEISEVRDELGINIISYEKVDNYLNIDGLSSLIQACDTVISVGNVNCHLAGALGKEIHVLVTDGSWWGWLLERDDSPWYASVKLYRQEKINDWDFPIKKLKNELKSID